jgi:hypothetical protein
MQEGGLNEELKEESKLQEQTSNVEEEQSETQCREITGG